VWPQIVDHIVELRKAGQACFYRVHKANKTSELKIMALSETQI